jgi:serine/threonine protein kinase
MFARDDSCSNSFLRPDTIVQGRYLIVRQIGRGGMGAVYETTDLRLGHTVALKQSLTDDARVLKQFEREARLLAQLNHPMLPRVSDFFNEGHRAFLVMQFIGGDDLATLLAQNPGPLPRHVVVAWADQLLDAIIYLHTHDRQIIHRDIKPLNLKVTSSGKIALLDFGLAKSQSVSGISETHSESLHGYSPRYAPLEQIHDTGTSPQSDIYALGATLYHLLTGVKPVDAVTQVTALMTSRPNPLKPAHEINPAVGVELSEILARAMAHDADARYRTASDFRGALRRLGRRNDSTGAKGLVYCEIEPLNAESSVPRLRAMAAVLLILLASFGVFCHYYSWRMPAIQAPPTVEEGRNLSPITFESASKKVLQSSRTTQPARKRIRRIIDPWKR